MYALSLILNWSTVGATVISAGKLFYRLGPHTLNALAAKVLSGNPWYHQLS